MTLTAATTAVTSVSSTSVSLSALAATGGVAPVVYQWYRGTAAGFALPGNEVAGATALSLVDTARSPGLTYYYVLQAQDGNSDVANYPEVAATTTPIPAGLYIGFEAVRTRLVGKVRFSDVDPIEDEGRMAYALANRLINEAEGQVEQDLSPRYAAPFVTDAVTAFANLPARPTKEILSTLCELAACIRIIETDFGTGTATDGEKYTKALQKRYDELRERLLSKKKEGQGWMYPPLPGLKLNYMNTEADDGYSGQVIVASGSAAQGFATGQINDPSATFTNGGRGD